MNLGAHPNPCDARPLHGFAAFYLAAEEGGILRSRLWFFGRWFWRLPASDIVQPTTAFEVEVWEGGARYEGPWLSRQTLGSGSIFL